MKRKSKPHQEDEPLKKKKRKSAKRFTLHFFFLGVFCITSAVILSLTVFFNVTYIEVKGNDRYSDKEVIQASGILLEENLFRIDTANAVSNLMARYPYFEKVSISRKLPSFVTINVTMATPTVAIQTQSGYVLASEAGKILQCATQDPDPALLKVKGLDDAEYREGAFMAETQPQSYEMLTEFLKVAQAVQLTSINYLDLSDQYNIKALYDNRVLLELGSRSKLDYKINFAKEMLTTKIPEDFGAEFEGVIDASFEKQLRVRPMELSTLLDGEVLDGAAAMEAMPLSAAAGGSRSAEEPAEQTIEQQPVAIPIREGESPPEAAAAAAESETEGVPETGTGETTGTTAVPESDNSGVFEYSRE